jgi:phosphinothricin acetyltransferase
MGTLAARSRRRQMTNSIRLVDTADARELLAIYEPIVRETAISFELEPPTLTEMRGRIDSLSRVFPWLVAETENGVSGYAYASRHRERAAYQWSVDVSVYVATAARGRGVGRALYTALLSLLADLSYCTAHAGIALPNDASVALHESMGFEAVGIFRNVGYKFGAWHDVGWWQRTLRPYGSNPSPPVSMAVYVSAHPLLRWSATGHETPIA